MRNEFDLVKNLPELTEEVLSSLPPSKWHKKAVQLIDANPDGKFAVACSGGVDSTLVLFLAKAYLLRQTNSPTCKSSFEGNRFR